MGKSKIYLALEKADIEIEQNYTNQVIAGPPRFPEKVERPERSHTNRETFPPIEHRSGREVSSVYDTEFVAAEQFRKLRNHIVSAGILGSTKTILVTSAVQGEGKSFVATNLAIGLAQDLHIHALLVDCDLRKPSLAQRFGVQNRYGIADYLVGQGDVSRLLIKTELDKLSILPSGSIQGNPTELIASNRMVALVEELKTRYNDRYVIFDSTPLLATSEVEVLAKLVDGVILVVRAGKTPRETVEQALNLLEREKLLGLILNNVEFKSSGLFLRYFGSTDYYYGYGKKTPQNQMKRTGRVRMNR